MRKIIKTVDYEIEPSGDCSKCECKKFIAHSYLNGEKGDIYFCRAFNVDFHWYSQEKIDRYQECIDYLAEQKSKVHCDGCRHFCYGYNFSICQMGEKIKFDQDFDPENWYSLNCRYREREINMIILESETKATTNDFISYKPFLFEHFNKENKSTIPQSSEDFIKQRKQHKVFYKSINNKKVKKWE